MDFTYLVLIAFILKIVNSYNPNRQQILNDINPNDQIIPFRHTNYDPTILENIHPVNFPEVEYPNDIIQSSKPFYLNMNPFSDDVKSSFDSLVSQSSLNAKPMPVFNFITKVNQLETNTSAKLDDNKLKINEVNLETQTFKDTIAAETHSLDANLDHDRHHDLQYSSEEKEEAKSSVEQRIDPDEIQYALEFIYNIEHDFNEDSTNITVLESIVDNDTPKIFYNEPSSELGTITSDVTSESNVTDSELNNHLHSPPEIFVTSSNSSMLWNDDIPFDNCADVIEDNCEVL